MELNRLINFLDTYLSIDEIDDSSWNGIQFEGISNVNKAVFAVDASIETFKKSASSKANIVIVHHGHFWKNRDPSINSWNKERIDILYKNDISLYACHLPLDRHIEVGNNAQTLKLLGANPETEFMMHKGKNIGWIGTLEKPISINEISGILKKNLKAECKILDFGKKKIKSIAVCSGGGSYSGFYEALDKGADLYITGDTAEVYYTAKDSGMNVIFAGHHTTETIGLKALQKVVEKEFVLDCTFIDIPTGL